MCHWGQQLKKRGNFMATFNKLKLFRVVLPPLAVNALKIRSSACSTIGLFICEFWLKSCLCLLSNLPKIQHSTLQLFCWKSSLFQFHQLQLLPSLPRLISAIWQLAKCSSWPSKVNSPLELWDTCNLFQTWISRKETGECGSGIQTLLVHLLS